MDLMTKKLDADQLILAAELLKKGQLVAFPTETVYGLGASIFCPEAIEQIFKVKGRPSDNPLIAHVCSIEQVEQIAWDIPDTFYRLAKRFFPGPLTVVLKRRSHIPSLVSAGLETIAVRMPHHPIALELISLVQAPLVAPSANLSGKPSSTQAAHVVEDFEGKIAAIIDGGKTSVGIESTVISLTSDIPQLLRPGSISKEEIEQVLGGFIQIIKPNHSERLPSPGMKYRHYCPQTPVRLFYSPEEVHAYLSTITLKRRIMYLAKEPLFPLKRELNHYVLCAKDLYFLLRLADQETYNEIIIFCDAETQRESGLMNRLLRASGITT